MSTEREKKTVNRLARILEPLFDVSIEVPGIWPLDGSELRLDILARPKRSAIEMGFDLPAFGIEVKDPKSKESVKKLLDCIMQAYTYGFCEFGGVRPSMVLVYPSIDKFFEFDFANKYESNSRERYSERELRILRRIMQRANVGELNLLPERQFEFRFEGGPYFSSRSGRSGIVGVGVRRYVGSRKRIVA